MDRALRHAARDPALRRPRRRPLRPAPRHPVRHARRRRRRSTTTRRAGPCATDRGDAVTARVLVMATGCLSAAKAARRSTGIDTLRRADVPHGPVAARGRRLHRPAGRRHRHRLVGHPGDPADRRAGRPPHRVPAHRRTSAMPAHNAPLDPRAGRRAQGRLPGPTASRPDRTHDRRRRSTPAPTSATSRPMPASARAPLPSRDGTRGRCTASRSTFADILIDPAANELAAEFLRERIRETVARSGGRRAAVAARRIPTPQATVPRHRLLRDVQPPQRRARRPAAPRRSTEITPTGIRTTASTSSSTSSCSPPGFDAMTGALLAIESGRPRRRDAAGEVGRPGRAPISAWRSPASRTCSSSPARAAPSVLTNMHRLDRAPRRLDRRPAWSRSTERGATSDRGRCGCRRRLGRTTSARSAS